jgi:hypothetical protein
MKKIFQILAQGLIVFIALFMLFYIAEPYFSPWFRSKKREYFLKKESDEAEKSIMLHIIPADLKMPIFLLYDE